MAVQTKIQIIGDASSFDRAMARVNKSAAAAAKSAQKQFSNLSSSVLSATGSLGKLSGLMIGGAGFAALTTAVSDGVSKIVEFEKATSNLAGILGTTPAQIADLTDQAKLLGSTTAFTASQVTQLQTELAKLGFSQTEIQQSTKAVLDLSSATGAELGDAAALAGATLRAFNLDASEMSRVTSVLAVSTTKSALDFGKLQTSMAIVSPVAKAFGFSIEDTVAMLGKLSDAGFDASSAATATRNILLNLANENGKLAKALGRPVRNAGELGSALAELRDKGVSLSEALAMTDKRSVAAFEAFMTQAEGIGKLSNELTNCDDALNEMVTTMTDNVQGSLDSLSSAWEGLMLAFSDSKGVFRTIIDGLTSIVQALTTLEGGIDGAMKKIEQTGKSNYDANRKNVQADMEKRLKQQITSMMASNNISEEDATAAVYELEEKRLTKKAAEDAALLKSTQEELKKITEAYESGGVDAVKSAGFGFQAARDRFGVLSSNGLIKKWIDTQKESVARLTVTDYANKGSLDIFRQLTQTASGEGANTVPAEVEDWNDNTIAGLKKHIAALKKQYESMNAMTQAPQMTAVKGQIDTLQDKLDELTGKAKKSSAAVKEIGAEGSLSYAKNQVDELNKAFEMAATEGERSALQKELATWKEAVRQMEMQPIKIDVVTAVSGAQKAISATPTSVDDFGASKTAESMYNEYTNYINGLKAQITSLGETMTDALSSGVEMEDLTPLMEQYEALGAAMQSATEKSDELKASIVAQREASAQAEELRNQFSGVSSVLDSMGSVGSDSFSALVGGISDIVGQLGELIPKLMAMSIAEGTAKVTETSTNWYEIIPGIAAVAASIISTFSALKFASGGVVGGSSYNADRVPAMVESGEMILNKRQQRNLFALLDGGSVGSNGASVTTMRLQGRDLVAVTNAQNKLISKLK